MFTGQHFVNTIFSRGGLKLIQGSFVRNGVVGVEVLPVGGDPIF
jgi:hypothetical protein